MKFEKINNKKLKITLSYNELPSDNDLDKLMSDTDAAQETFFKLLDEANKEVGFDTKDYKIKIDAKSLYNGDLIFTVTKLVKLKKTSVSVKPKKVIKTESKTQTYSIYKFDNFDDFCSFCTYLKTNKIKYLNRLAKSCILYKYNDAYYLSLKQINENFQNLHSFYSSITEFSKYYSSKDLFISTLNEYGTVYLDNNALILGQKYFA